MKKLVLLLILMLLLSSLVACFSNETESDSIETSVTGIENIDTVTTAEIDKYPVLPKTNMDGMELHFYNYDDTWLTWAINTLVVEMQSGDLVNDEIYLRNRRIEETYNCNILETAVTNTTTNFKSLMLAGDDTYDIVFVYDENTAGYYSEGLIQSWDVLPYIEFDAPWWLNEANVVFQLKDKQFAAVGAFCLSMYSRSFIMIFNKDMYNDYYDIENNNLYKHVNDGTWTVSKFAEIAKEIVTDINGDGVMDDKDQYGIATAVKLHFGSLISGAGIRYIDIDSDGYPYFAIPDNPNALNVMQDIFNLHNGNDIFRVVASDVHGGSADGAVYFNNGQTLFHGLATKTIQNFRGLDFDIGILPYPKHSESQEKYYSLTSGAGVAVIPITTAEERYENISILLEAMSRDSYYNLLPTYREVVLKTKYSRDQDSSDMLDIIFNSAFFDLGLSVFPSVTYYEYMKIYLTMNDTVVSMTETLQNKVQGELDKLIQTIEAQ